MRINFFGAGWRVVVRKKKRLLRQTADQVGGGRARPNTIQNFGPKI